MQLANNVKLVEHSKVRHVENVGIFDNASITIRTRGPAKTSQTLSYRRQHLLQPHVLS